MTDRNRDPLVFDVNRGPGGGEIGCVHPDGSITYRGRRYRCLREVPSSCRLFRADLSSTVQWRRLYRAVDPAHRTASAAAARLRKLYEADRREHRDVPPVGMPKYAALRRRDARRRREATDLLVGVYEPTAADLYHVAWLLNHGDDPEEARQAHLLAARAASLGHEGARWLSAAAFDRWCMYEGRPQKYGTQIVPDGRRFRLWDTNPSTTDDERAALDVPPLAEMRRRADDLTRREPQPPLDLAPGWLRAALRRWRKARSPRGTTKSPSR